MRKSISIIFLLFLSGLFMCTQAQVTAVMQAKVKIISGAGLTQIQALPINLNAASELSSNLEAGSFSLVTAPGTDVNVVVTQSSDIANEKGESLTFENFSVDKTSTESGSHFITVNGKLNTSKELLSGHYEGNITAVVEYL